MRAVQSDPSFPPPPGMSAPPRSELAAAAAAFLRLGEERPPAAAAMNLLQRKGRPDWRPPREEEPRKGWVGRDRGLPPRGEGGTDMGGP